MVVKLKVVRGVKSRIWWKWRLGQVCKGRGMMEVVEDKGGGLMDVVVDEGMVELKLEGGWR
jgi:hypothetical protein